MENKKLINKAFIIVLLLSLIASLGAVTFQYRQIEAVDAMSRAIADVNGDGKIELILGLWTENTWRTVVIDPLRGFNSKLSSLENSYFWGCHDLPAMVHPK